MKKRYVLILIPFLFTFFCLFLSETKGYINYMTYNITSAPSSLNTSFYDKANSRTFCWVTDDTVTESRLFLSKTGQFDNSYSEGICITTQSGINIHKVTVENLTFGSKYFYKVGGNNKYITGEFTVPQLDIKTKILHLNDAQTKNPNLINVFKNTVEISLYNNSYDFIAFGGDLYDNNMYYLPKLPSLEKMDGYIYKCISQNKLPSNIPIVYTQGNHEYATPNLFQSFSGFKNQSKDNLHGYYSFNYNNIHFIVLDSNGVFSEQKEFLESDLSQSLENSEIKWRIVMLHNGPYSTGDHCDDQITKEISEIFPPVFAKYGVDIVLQAHDHIYSKTTGYEWLNGNGNTYYICMGASGHRYGENSADKYVSEIYKNTDIPINIGEITVNSSVYKKGNQASLNPDYPMFGSIDIINNKLIYNSYIINQNKNQKELIDRLVIEKN